MSSPAVGDWVQVWGQVVNTVLPDDYEVRFESHNEDYVGVVRKDRVEKPQGLPEFARRCTALQNVTVRLEGLTLGDVEPIEEGDEVLLRCTKHEAHSGKHKHRKVKWSDTFTDGYIEDNH